MTQLTFVKTLFKLKMLKFRIIDTSHHNFKAGFCTVRKSSIPNSKLASAALRSL